MKKIIIAFFSFILLFFAQNSFAATVWNTASNDCPTVAVANYTTNTGYVDPCWPLSSVSASSGNSVNIRIYYHNTSTQNVTNTRVVLNAPTGASTSHSFTGQIISDQGSLSFGPVKINTSSNSTLSWPQGGTHWLPNQIQTDATLLNNQTGAEILSGGLNIGTIAPGWETQGSIVIVFSVIGQTTPPPLIPTGTLTPANNSCSIPLGKSNCDINFSWNTNNSTGTSAITRDGGPTVATGNSGSKALTVPYNSATFRLYNNAIELDTSTVTSFCTTGTSWNGSVCVENVNPTYNCSIVNFTVGGALSTTVTLGNSVELAWTTTGCNYVNISNVGNNIPASGNRTIYPNTSTTYTLTGYGSSGSNPNRSVSITVIPQVNPTYACSISSFTADNLLTTTIKNNESVRIYWNTNNCTTINITGVGTNLLSSGSHNLYPSKTTRYTITASGLVGTTQTRYVDVIVNPNTNPSYVCTIEDFSVNNTYITTGGSIRINWETENCNMVKISNLGNVNNSGSQILYPINTTNYILTAYGLNGLIQNKFILVTVSPQVIPVPLPVYNTCAITTIATNINQNTAQLNGFITGLAGANTYFEYGPTVNLGNRTNSRYITSNTNFSETISTLSPNTIYFFRIISDCQNGNSQGAIEIFRTLATVKTNTNISNTVISQGITITETDSPIMLKIENRYKTISVGEIVDYTTTYKNISKTTLTEAILQVVVPKGITITNASEGTYTTDTNTLTVPLGTLTKRQEGIVYLRGTVESIPFNLAQVVTTAILVYTNTKGSQENVIAYVLNNPKETIIKENIINDDNNSLAAATLFGGVSSLNFIEWLIILILILLTALIVRSFYLKTAPSNGTRNNQPELH